MARKKQSEGCETDMTPMIDVVFQLIIFFIVTIKMDESKRENIELELGVHGPPIKDMTQSTMVIEIDRHGWIGMHGAALTHRQLRSILVKRRKGGEFPVLIRACKRAKHKDIKTVMDICTESGLWKINFMAIKEVKR